ncbi:MAG: protein-disulfide reductase DsbD domain-containing protein [Pseudomonadota bacterium]
MKKPVRLAIAVCLAALSAGSLAAREPFDDPIAARIIPGWDLPDGRHVAGLELVLEPGWKTYWRSPGDAGIPPSFDWGRARNVRGVEVSWPTPDVHWQNGMRSIGYDGRVVIPLTVAPRRGGDMRLRGRMDLGVCADVCMPHSINLDAVLSPGSTARVGAIAAALADQPYSGAEAGVRAAVCALRPTDDGIRLEARLALPAEARGDVVVIEPGVADVWVSEAEVRREDGWLVAASDLVHTSGRAFAIDRGAVTITVLGGSYAVEISGCSAG